MVDHIDYISIREVLARVARHPLMQDMDLEAGVQYTLDFFGRMGLPDVHENKVALIDIHEYRGELPCDIVRVDQVKNVRTDQCMRSMTDNFNGYSNQINSEDTFKTKGRYIFTSFKDGKVLMAYQSIKTDEDGLPMLVNNPLFLETLEAFIKMKVFTWKFDCGIMKPEVLKVARDDYYFLAKKCINRFIIPSQSEMRSITGMMHRLIPSRNEFENGFKTLGDKEHYRRHQG